VPRSTTLDAPAPRVRLARRIRPESVGVALALCAVAWLVVVPLGYLGWRGFTTGGDLTLEHLRDVFGVVGFGHIMGATTIFALGSAALGLVIGGTLAFLFVRTDLPFRRVLLLVSLTPLLVPGILMTFAWIFLASPRAGILNGLLEPIVGPEALDVFGLPGMVFVESLRLAPIAMLVLAGALRGVDPSLEESAIVSGVGRLTVIRRVTLPVLRPAIGATGLLLTLLAIESFDVPVLLGIPGDVRVITSGIWASYQRSAGELGSVAAGGTLLLVLTVLGTMALAASTRGRRRFETIGRGHGTDRRLLLGRWRTPALLAVLGYLGVAVALPLAALVWMSTQPYLAPVSREALGRASSDGYAAVFGEEATRDAMLHSLAYAMIAATLITALALGITWLAARTRVRGRRLVEVVAFAPIAVPGLVLGAGILVLYVRLPLAVYGTAAVLVVAYLTLYLPHAVRFQGVGMSQVGREVEEAATASGVRRIPTLTRITLPLIAPSVAAAWVVALLLSLYDVAASLLLYAPGTEVIGVRLWELYEAGSFRDLAALGIVCAVPALVLGALALSRGGLVGSTRGAGR
jgi:iron(III) transport system permease protein